MMAGPQAELTMEEALDLAPVAHARMIGSQRFVFVYQALGMVLGMLAGAIVGVAISLPLQLLFLPTAEWLPMQALLLIGGILGWGLGLAKAHKRHRAKFLAGIGARGSPGAVLVDYAIGDDSLDISTPRVTYRIAWPSILEIIDGGEAWLVQVDLTTFIVAKRAFAGEAQQRAFLADLLRRVRPQARERSKEAVAFAQAS
jgi:hypothetical protein